MSTSMFVLAAGRSKASYYSRLIVHAGKAGSTSIFLTRTYVQPSLSRDGMKKALRCAV